MIVPELFHYINNSVCFFVGVPLNVLLAWMIINRSPNDMRQYQPILLLGTYTDIIYLIDFLVVMPVMAVKDGLCVMFSLGPFGSLPNPGGFVVYMTWAFLLSFSEFSLAVPFVYRYYVICRGKKWGLTQFLAMLLVPVALSLEHVCLCLIYGYVPSEEAQIMANEHFGFPADSNKTYVMVYFTQTIARTRIPGMNMPTISAIDYILIVICGRKLYNHLNSMTELHSSQEYARVLNKQISTTLILQASIPLVVEFLPMMELASSMVSGVNYGDSTLYAVPIFAWIPVLNPLVSMWVVQAYRRQLFAWIGRACEKIVGNTSVLAINPTLAADTRVAPDTGGQFQLAGSNVV